MRKLTAIVLVVAVCGGAGLWVSRFGGRAALLNENARPSLQIVPPLSRFSPDVRVNITPPTGRSANLEIDGPYAIRPVGNSRAIASGDGLEASPLTVTANGFRIGSTTYPLSRLEIVTEKSPAIWLGDHQYRGRLRLLRQPQNRFVAINVLPMDEYLASVVDSEMPAAFPDEARRAQAIVARTYVLYQLQPPYHPLFDVYASTQSQKYLGFQYRDSSGRWLAGESAASRRIVAETSGRVCTWQGKLFCTYYSAVCGGRTIPGEQKFADAVPALASVECNWCREADRYRWTIELDRAKVESKLVAYFRNAGRPFTKLASIRSSSSQPAIDDKEFEVGDGKNKQRLSRKELMQALPEANFPSDRFTLSEAGGKIRIEGQGHGHGVGLCQWGARGLALDGKNSLEIVRHYYPGAQIVILE